MIIAYLCVQIIAMQLSYVFASLLFAFYFCPRFSDPAALTITSVSSSGVIVGSLQGALGALVWIGGPLDFYDFYMLAGTYFPALTSLLICGWFCVVWRRIRRRETYEWFRFEE